MGGNRWKRNGVNIKILSILLILSFRKLTSQGVGDQWSLWSSFECYGKGTIQFLDVMERLKKSYAGNEYQIFSSS